MSRVSAKHCNRSLVQPNTFSSSWKRRSITRDSTHFIHTQSDFEKWKSKHTNCYSVSTQKRFLSTAGFTEYIVLYSTVGCVPLPSTSPPCCHYTAVNDIETAKGGMTKKGARFQIIPIHFHSAILVGDPHSLCHVQCESTCKRLRIRVHRYDGECVRMALMRSWLQGALHAGES